MSEIRKTYIQATFLFSLCFKDPDSYQEEEIRFVVAKINEGNSNVPSEKLINEKPVFSVGFIATLLKVVILSREILEKENDIRNILNRNSYNRYKNKKLPY